MPPSASLRRRGADDLGLKPGLSGRVLPFLVAAMVILAALAATSAIAAAGLAAHWRSGAATLATVQVPQPNATLPNRTTRAAAVAALLAQRPGLIAHQLTEPEILAILQPWLGNGATTHLAFELPAVFDLRGPQGPDLAASLDKAAPGTLLEQNALWAQRLSGLAESLRSCALLAVAIVTAIAAAVIALAARAGLAARRDSIEIVHGLGATDGLIAHRFAARVTLLVVTGALLGLCLVIPILLGLAALLAPFQPSQSTATRALLPTPIWLMLPTLPLAAALIGWLATQLTVRAWLAKLP